MIKPEVRGFFDPVTHTWSYIVWAPGNADTRCAIIDSVHDYDPATCRLSTKSADTLIAFVQEKGLQVEWILETHIHADHLTAAHYLKERLGGKIGMTKRITNVLDLWIPFFGIADDTPADGSQFDYLFSDDESFTVGAMEARIISVPGHTPADSCYVIGDAVFVGDAMFLPDIGSGRCDFPGGSAEDSYDSSRKLFSLPDDYRMYVGHDYPPAERFTPMSMTTVLDQKTSNSRLRLGIAKDEYVTQRNADDYGKEAPSLILPSLQYNLRAGSFGKARDGVQYVVLPVDKFS